MNRKCFLSWADFIIGRNVQLLEFVFDFWVFFFFFGSVHCRKRVTVKARTEPNQIEPTEIAEPAQSNLRKLTDNYDYRYRVLGPLPIRTLVLLTSPSLIIIIIIIIIIRSIIIIITLK